MLNFLRKYEYEKTSDVLVIGKLRGAEFTCTKCGIRSYTSSTNVKHKLKLDNDRGCPGRKKNVNSRK